jgi:magnesium transporter
MKQTDIESILEEIRGALTENDWERATKIVEALRPPDQADVFEELSPETQSELLPRLDPEDSADILEELEDEDAAEIAQRLDSDDLVRILDKMEPDEAADLLGDIPQEQVDEALQAVEDADELRTLLVHSDDTAGGLMTSAEVVLHKDMTVGEAIDLLRSERPDTETVYYLFVVDDQNRLVGVVSLRQLIIASPSITIGEIMDSEVISILAEADQEEAARLMARYDLIALPVLDSEMRLLGVITHDDLVDVLEQEATEDIYRLGGVPDEAKEDVSVGSSLRTRLPWLVLNLATAMVSGVVLSIFESTIAAAAVLAAFFPIVAGVSGSAGTQTLTVTVRGMALGEISRRNGTRILLREMAIGVANGVVIGLLVALIAFVWKDEPVLGFVVGTAVLMNMIAAGFAGFLVPMTLQLVKIDPALASPVLVTTFTDTMGYFIYLGLATIVIIGVF